MNTEDWLRDELERTRQQLSDLQDHEYREQQRRREQRRIEIQAEREFQERRAQSWPEALRKMIPLAQRELAAWIEHEGDSDVSYVRQLITGCIRAGELWDKAEAAKNREIQFYLAQIEAIRNNIRLEVAAQLVEDAKFGNREAWKELAGQIERNELKSFLDI